MGDRAVVSARETMGKRKKSPAVKEKPITLTRNKGDQRERGGKGSRIATGPDSGKMKQKKKEHCKG